MSLEFFKPTQEDVPIDIEGKNTKETDWNKGSQLLKQLIML